MINEDLVLEAIREIDLRVSCGDTFEKALNNSYFFDLNEEEANLLLSVVNNMSTIFGTCKETIIQFIYNGFLRELV
ncbi:hypothetical protein [Metabacillus litoralis]|uniref:hypothetical protein n=1 Tax=Metabacillus litoralis TaxID=152268 RepID=UPI00203A73F4|nr:hypothetical protein [Metabacillus litoralis]MCM3161006.1 hypothetical protein [Metabacillus litoralis]